MICFLDIDGILTDFTGAACELHGVKDPYESETGWDMCKLLGMPAQDFFKPMNYDFWANLEWTEDSWIILEIVEKKFGKNVCLLSSMILNDECASGKYAWIKNNLPEYRKRSFLGAYKEACAYDGSYLIDDRDRNVTRFNEQGGKAFLYPRPWNSQWEYQKKSIEMLEKFMDRIVL